MKFKLKEQFILVLGVALAVTHGRAFAETQTSEAVVAGNSKTKFTANLELRPSVAPSTNAITGEDSIEAGVVFTPDVALTYAQGFATSINDTSVPASERGLSTKLDVGFLRTKVSNIVVDKKLGLSLSYQNRLYVPTRSVDQTAGFIFADRNYVSLKKTLTDSVSLTLSEVLIPMVYEASGRMSGSKPVAHAAFENRVYLITDVKFTDKLSLSIPLMFHQTRYRDFNAAAENNDRWGYFVWTYPELQYALTDNFYLGAAYYSDNLIKADLSGLALGQGLENGIVQLVLGASI